MFRVLIRSLALVVSVRCTGAGETILIIRVRVQRSSLRETDGQRVRVFWKFRSPLGPVRYSKISDGLALTRVMDGILRIAGPKFSGAIPLELAF